MQRYREIDKELALPRVVPRARHSGRALEANIYDPVRGDCWKTGEVSPRRYLEVLARPGERFAPSGSGRRELAERMASAATADGARDGQSHLASSVRHGHGPHGR